MTAKTKEIFKNLEFGLFELLLGALMAIGLVGYFAGVPADLDWTDHTISFILFSYLFYKLSITSLLFGKTSKLANAAVIISYFSLFFKDIMAYTSSSAFKFKFMSFVDVPYAFLSSNLELANLTAFYLGIAGIFAISIYLVKKIGISHPSFLYAVFPGKIKNMFIKFSLIFISLLGFYYFVYNMILEWLEFTIDDPVVAVGIAFFIYKIAKHREKFRPKDFIFKIGDFSSGWYVRFVSLFHYKRTLPLAISGMLILHALSDLGVFAYSLIFLKENFYLGFLNEEHAPFLKLFLSDMEVLPGHAAIPLFIVYLLNSISLVILLLLPVIAWIRMFSQKELHFSRVCLFFIYSSAVAYMLMPGYLIRPLENPSFAGADINSVSVMENGSVLGEFFPDRAAMIIAASLIAVSFGLAVYLLGGNSKIRKELYAISVIGGLAFYAIYIYYFFSSQISYFYDNIAATIFTPNFLIGIILLVFLALSAIFYIGGYLMLLYEIVMEYHRRKWSEQVDDEIVVVIKKFRRFRGIISPKKAQSGELFKYALIAVVSVSVLVLGYKMIDVAKERSCKTELAKFEIDLRNIDKSLRFGAKELRTYDAPCNADKIYFLNLNRDVNADDFRDIPLIYDSLKTGGSSNVFIVRENEVKRSFYAGNLEMVYPYNICLVPKFGKISFFIEGAGKSAKIAGACSQPECTYIPIDIDEDKARSIIKEAIGFGCSNCPTDLNREAEKIRPTRQNAELFRKFTFCDGITNVEILIRPRKNAEIKDFRFYEFIPKSCIDDLDSYLAENIEGNVEVKADPLIMWQFSSISNEQKLLYKLGTALSDECRQSIQGLGVAQFVEAAKLREQEIKENTPPTIGGLPDVSLAGIGLKKNAISNLWKYAQDKETNPQNLVYTIIDQTNSNLADCSINAEKHVDCEVKQNKDGFSRITVQVDDLQFTDRTSFSLEVSEFCKKHEKQGCVGNSVFWFDSCGNREEFVESCPSGQVCNEGKCEKDCKQNANKKCGDDDKIYWLDSCGKKGQLHFDCRDNLVRNQCKNSQCCIGNFFCKSP